METKTTGQAFRNWWNAVHQHEAQTRDIEQFGELQLFIQYKILPLLLRDKRGGHGRGELIVTNSWQFNSLPMPVLGYKDSRFSLRFTRPPGGDGWVISVHSKYTVIGSFHRLFREDVPVDADHMQQLPQDWWFESLVSNRTNFTVHLLNDEEFFTFVLILVDLVEEDD